MFQADTSFRQIEQMVVTAYQEGAPGAAMILVKNGQILYRKGIGLANLEHQVPLTPDMPFRLASITKPVTSTAVLMLVEAGRLALTDSLTDLLPDYPMGETPITIEHLLTHTSGIAEYSELPVWWAVHRQDVSVDQLIDLFKDQPKAFAPGTRWSYCNSGYVLLGAIIEKISGKSYGDFLADHIFSPLGMIQTSYEVTPGSIIPHMASGYTKTPDGYRHSEYFSNTHLYAAGGLVSTLDDLGRWYTALCNGKLLNKESLRRMWT
ncbi:MAG: beta-lactamase family protein, partial [Methanoregulaceae archaeon]|nr:beta-lactamase family protein [Methanoregulaceae archaeon]